MVPNNETIGILAVTFGLGEPEADGCVLGCGGGNIEATGDELVSGIAAATRLVPSYLDGG